MIPGSERSPWLGVAGNPLQYSCLENPMDREAWQAIVIGLQIVGHKCNDLACILKPQFSSVAQLFPTICDPKDCSMPGFPVHHQFLEPTQIHVHRVGDVIQPSYPLSTPSPPAFSLAQHQGLFKQRIGASASASVLPMNIQDQFPLG